MSASDQRKEVVNQVKAGLYVSNKLASLRASLKDHSLSGTGTSAKRCLDVKQRFILWKKNRQSSTFQFHFSADLPGQFIS